MPVRPLVLLAMLVALLAGCGDDASSGDRAATTTARTTPTTATTTPAQTTTTERKDEREKDKPKAKEKEESDSDDQASSLKDLGVPTAEGSEPASKKDPAYRRFVKAMDRECSRYQREGTKAASNVTGEREAQREYYAALAEITANSVKRMRAIAPPPKDRAKIAKFTRRIADNVPLLRDIGDAIVDEDREALQRLATKLARNSVIAAGIAQRYGFKVCGGGESSSTSG